jgi:hypothetical protein
MGSRPLNRIGGCGSDRVQLNPNADVGSKGRGWIPVRTGGRFNLSPRFLIGRLEFTRTSSAGPFCIRDPVVTWKQPAILIWGALCLRMFLPTPPAFLSIIARSTGIRENKQIILEIGF